MLNRTCYLVLGTPRSGSSCVAGVLHRLGVRMALADFVPATSANPRGFYEDQELVSRLLLPTGRPLTLAEEHRLCSWLRPALAARCAPGEPWGFKSHLLAFAWPYFLRCCPWPVKVIRTERPLAVSRASWRSAFGSSCDRVVQVAQALEALDAASDLLLLRVPYDKLLASPQETVAAIADFAGVPVTEEAVRWVDATQRKFK